MVKNIYMASLVAAFLLGCSSDSSTYSERFKSIGEFADWYVSENSLDGSISFEKKDHAVLKAKDGGLIKIGAASLGECYLFDNVDDYNAMESVAIGMMKAFGIDGSVSATGYYNVKCMQSL